MRTLSARRVLRFLRAPVVLVVLFIALRVSGVIESIAFYHPKARDFPVPVGTQDLTLTTSDGVKLNAWFIPGEGCTPETPGPAIIFCHGNAGAMPFHKDFYLAVPRMGISVLSFDYRGFGKSQAASWLVRDELARDAQAAYAALLQRPEVDPKHIGAVGMSLGASFATELARTHPEIRAVSLISGFSSWQGVASDYVPVLGTLLIPSGLDAVDAMPALKGRSLLLLHGDRDEIVPYRHSLILQRAAQAAGVDVELYTAKNIGHLDVTTGRSPGGTRMAHWLAEHLQAASEPPAQAVH